MASTMSQYIWQNGTLATSHNDEGRNMVKATNYLRNLVASEYDRSALAKAVMAAGMAQTEFDDEMAQDGSTYASFDDDDARVAREIFGGGSVTITNPFTAADHMMQARLAALECVVRNDSIRGYAGPAGGAGPTSIRAFAGPKYFWQADATNPYDHQAGVTAELLNMGESSWTSNSSDLFRFAATADRFCDEFDTVASAAGHTYHSLEDDRVRVNDEASGLGAVTITNPFTAIEYLKSLSVKIRAFAERLDVVSSRDAAAGSFSSPAQMYSFRTVSSEGTDWQTRLLDEIRSVLDALAQQNELSIIKAILRAQGVRENLYKAMRSAGTPLRRDPEDCDAVSKAVALGDPEIVFGELSTAEFLLYRNMFEWLNYWDNVYSENGAEWRNWGAEKQALVSRILAGPNEVGEMPPPPPQTSPSDDSVSHGT